MGTFDTVANLPHPELPADAPANTMPWAFTGINISDPEAPLAAYARGEKSGIWTLADAQGAQQSYLNAVHPELSANGGAGYNGVKLPMQTYGVTGYYYVRADGTPVRELGGDVIVGDDTFARWQAQKAYELHIKDTGWQQPDGTWVNDATWAGATLDTALGNLPNRGANYATDPLGPFGDGTTWQGTQGTFLAPQMPVPASATATPRPATVSVGPVPSSSVGSQLSTSAGLSVRAPSLQLAPTPLTVSPISISTPLAADGFGGSDPAEAAKRRRRLLVVAVGVGLLVVLLKRGK